MTQVKYVVSPRPGGNLHGAMGDESLSLILAPGGGSQVSLNLETTEVFRYDRMGDDLQITLVDGRVLVLLNYFDSDLYGANQLFLSVDGYINEVNLTDTDATLQAHYGPTNVYAEWGPFNELIFIDEQVSNVAAFIGESDFLGPVLGAAGIGGLLMLADSGGGGAPKPRIPTVDDPEAVIRVGGNDQRTLLISGTAEPGSDVSATIDGITMSAVANKKGGWNLAFDGATFPNDGSYADVAVTVTQADGLVTTLDGPTFLIDTTPPRISIEDGTVSNGDLFNAQSHASGVRVSGTAEPESTVTLTLGEINRTAVVGANGRWSFTLGEAALPAGEYTRDITVTATDSFGNRTTLTDALQIDTVANPLAIDPVMGGITVCDADSVEGFTITGTSAPGALTTVSFAGIRQDLTAGPNGVWSMKIPPGALPEGEYSATVTATSVDAAGNGTTMAAEVQVDTLTVVELTNIPLTGDDVFNAAERAAGKTLTGKGEAGATVDVTILPMGAPRLFSTADIAPRQTAIVAEDGSWTVTFDPESLAGPALGMARSSESTQLLPSGTYDATLQVVATDRAGNTATVFHDFRVDTETTVTLTTALIETDGVVNAAERADGIVVTGQGEPGASVVLNVEGAQFFAVVDAAGDWSVTLPAEIVPEGTYDLPVAATATDSAGNEVTASGSIAVDTQTSVSVDTGGAGGDGIVNAAERAAGVTLTGRAEAGAEVLVTLGAITHAATASADGSWSADFAAAEIRSGEQAMTVTATATDAAGNTATASDTLTIDTLVRDFASAMVPGGSDRIVNAAEAAQGITFGGTTEPGSAVTVTLAGVRTTATVSANGDWSVTFASDQLPSGERTAMMTAVATDAAGNTETITQSVRFDTDPGPLTIDSAPIEGDNVVNFVEASNGVILTGTSSPGQVVQVTIAGVTLSVLTDSAGNWSAPFNASEVAPGTYEAQITATITDSAGNIKTQTDSVQVDTNVVNFALSQVPVEGDGIVNALEAADGVRLVGTTEPGASVEIVFGGMTYAAVVDMAGNWRVDIPATDIPRGESVAPFVVNTTDLAGNSPQISSGLIIDTEVNRLALDGGLFTADGVLNAHEVNLGLTLTGQVEAGSHVVLTLGGVVHAADVDSSGNWTADISGEDIPRGTLDTSILIEATDLAGNTLSMTQSVSIDTDRPSVPVWVDYTRGRSGLNSVTLDTVPHTVEIGHLVVMPGGVSVVDVEVTSSFDIPDVGTYHRFDDSAADGSHLVVSYSDNAGNTTSAFLVTDDPASNEVRFTDQMARVLGEFDVDLIDLSFAEDTNLTLTESQILALSRTTDTVSVLGDSDDSVFLGGAIHTGTTEVEGKGFNVYMLGDASILIDDHINHVNTGVV